MPATAHNASAELTNDLRNSFEEIACPDSVADFTNRHTS